MRLAQGWALLAAGGLGLNVAAATPPTKVAPAEKPAAKAPAKHAAAAPVDPLDRLAEIKVELAWLTDPQTFPCQLAARAVVGSIEVGGVVGSEPARQRAVQLAQQYGRRPVVDKLIVLPTLVTPPMPSNNENLCRAAATAMTRAFTKFPGSFEVAADARGQVTISGDVPTCEDKLAMSRRLGQLVGCSSVVNNLTVAKVMREGKVHTPISKDGTLVLAGEPTEVLVSVAPPEAVPLVLTPNGLQAAPGAATVVSGPVAPAAKPAKAKGSITPVVYQTTEVPQPPSPYGGTIQQPPALLPTTVASAAPALPATKPTVAFDAPKAAPKPSVSADTQKLVQRIEAVGKVRDVEVKPQGPKELLVRVVVPSESEGQDLGRQIMSLPELAPYKVDLQVRVK